MSILGLILAVCGGVIVGWEAKTIGKFWILITAVVLGYIGGYLIGLAH